MKNKKNKHQNPVFNHSESAKATADILLPQWCDNIAQNMQEILKHGSISRLCCSSYPECWKLTRLRSIIKSTKEYDIDFVEKETELNRKDINRVQHLCMCSSGDIAGTPACGTCKHVINVNRPALVISGGPSVKQYQHLDLLKEHGFNGDIFCVASKLRELQEHGIKPDYVVSIDAEETDVGFLEGADIDTSDLTGLFSIVCHSRTNEVFRGKKMFFQGYLGGLLPNVSYLLFLLTKTPIVNTAGNVGSACLSIAANVGYNPIVLIGMDLSFPSFESMIEYYDKIHLSWTDPVKRTWLPHMWKEEMNPVYQKPYYLDQVFGAYTKAANILINTLAQSGKTIINCTEQGGIYGKHVRNIRFEEYLNTIQDIL